ncbi:hypothetical protein DRN93_05905 [archaeon]|nr:MAG: hypothetical protein DRN93_05905 [archaeon]
MNGYTYYIILLIIVVIGLIFTPDIWGKIVFLVLFIIFAGLGAIFVYETMVGSICEGINRVYVVGKLNIGMDLSGNAWYEPSFCRIRKPHSHYELHITFYDPFGSSKYYLKLEYCPLMKKVVQIEPKPVIVDELVYDVKEYEGKSSHWGE